MPLLVGPAMFKTGAAFVASGMTAGAFGAHALAPRLGEKVATWHTASNYLIFNGLGLIALSQHPAIGRRWAGTMIAAGGIMFSGSIFGLMLWRNQVGKILGPITPIGGLILITGYASLLF